MKSLLLLIPFLLITSQSFSKEKDTLKVKKKYVKYLDLRIENGAMLSNGTEMGDQIITSSYYNGLDLRLAFRKDDPDNIYSNVYRRPYTGIGFYSSTFHNEDVGKPNAVYFFLTIPFAFERSKKLTFAYTAAFGLSYNFTPFDSINNPANIFIGSEKNVYVHLGVVMNLKLGKRFALNGTIGFKHFSNGSYSKPNAGINLVPLTLGLSYKLNDQEVLLEKREVPKYIKHNLWNISYSAGSKNYDINDEHNYFKSVLNVSFLRQINYKYGGGIGMDFFYSAGAGDRNTSDQSAFSKAFSCAVVGTWEWSINKNLYVPIGIGLYLKRNKENEEIEIYYERVGMRYRFNNNMFIGVTIKAHGGKADFFEWALGYTIKNDKNRY